MSFRDGSSSPPWARFPARLVAARLVAGMTQSGLAEACGRSGNGWVANFEAGANALPRHLDDVYLLAKAMGAPAEWLLFGRMFEAKGERVAMGAGGPPWDLDANAGDWDLALYPGAAEGAAVAEGTVVLADCGQGKLIPGSEQSLYLMDVRGRALLAEGRLDAEGRLVDTSGKTLKSRVVGTCVVSPARSSSRARRGK